MVVSFCANPISKAQAHHFKNKIIEAKSIDIICHINADEDSVACAKAIQWYATKLKKPSRIFSDSKLTYKSNDKTKNYIDLNKKTIPKKFSNTIFCVDFSSYSRLKDYFKDAIKNAENLLCIDHHDNADISNNINEIDHILTAQEIKKLSHSNIYIDSTAKACSAIILELFKTLKVKIPQDIKANLYCGLTDDLRKNKYIIFDNTLNPIKTSLFFEDLNTQKIYSRLTNSLNKKKRNKIIKHLNVLASLNQDEKAFQERLWKDLKITSKQKLAYVIIPPDDSEWIKLGRDNHITSVIMNNFRVSALNENKNLDSIMIFYQDNNGYRMSAHSRNNSLMNYFDFLRQHEIPYLQAGGHPDRAGGTIETFDRNESINWAMKIINNFEKFLLKN